MLERLRQGQKLLVLRYGKQIISNCIELHEEKIEDIGFCWFGKLGTIPSNKSIEAVLEEDDPAIVIYARGAAYLCEVSEIAYEQPESGCPDYYKDELFDKLTFPSVYFRLTKIEELETRELSKFTVVSSGNSAINTLMHSMSSFLLVTYGKESVDEKKEKKVVKKEKRLLLPENDCVYRKSGVCNLKSFVNYQYECARPNSCIKQKR